MNCFKDNKGHVWQVRVDVNAARRLRDMCGLQVFDLGSFDRLTRDPALAADAMRAVVAPAVPADEFGQLVDRDAIPAMTDALMRAIVDFFPSAATRKALTSMLDGAADRRQSVETGGDGSPSSPASRESTPAG